MTSGKEKQALIADAQIHKTDTGSPSVQVSILSRRVKELTEHLKLNKHDFMARRGLLQMVGQRKRLLRYLASTDSKQYLQLIEKLGIRR